MRVHVVGDSHAGKFYWWRQDHPEGHEYILYGLGGISAHSFAVNDTDVAKKARKIFDGVQVGDKDLILLVLGDGDCRVHFYEHHMRDGVPLEDLINTTVERYGEFILKVDKPIAVLDVPPAQSITEQYDFLYYGSREIRAEIAIMFNSRLKKWCDKNGILFIGIHRYLTDEKGFLKDEYAHPDGAHVLHSAVEFVDRVIDDYASQLED